MFERFRLIARKSAHLVGHPGTFLVLVVSSALWMLGGFILGFSPTYQLYYNTAVSAITLWLVALLQNSQNADTQALHLKIDELLRAQQDARTDLVDLEHRPQGEVEQREAEFKGVRSAAHDHEQGG